MISDEEPRQWMEYFLRHVLSQISALICIGETAVQQELSVLALIRGKDRYVFVYDDDSREELIEAIRAQAASPSVNLSWYDAAVLTDRARQQAVEAAKAKVSTKN